MTSVFDTLMELTDAELDTDLLGSGPNIRIRAGEVTHFAIEDRTGYFKVPEPPSLTRLQLSDQNGMPVLRATVAVKDERIGLVGDDDVLTALPCYTKAAFATWRSWIHLMNVEFMNVDVEGAKTLTDLVLAKGFVQYEPRGTTTFERKTTPLVDREAPGRTLAERYEKGIRLESLVLVPDMRVDVLSTEYVDGQGQTVRRPAFTNFIDVLITNMTEAIKANAGGDTQEKRTANTRLSVLTGHNQESGWPLRPTLGYLTPVKGDEISLFGDRGAASSEEAAPAETEGETVPAPECGADDTPFS